MTSSSGMQTPTLDFPPEWDIQMKTLISLWKNRCLPQTLLFHASNGDAMGAFVRKWVASIYCEGQNACLQCPSCQEVLGERQPDVWWMESSESTHKVAVATALQEHLQTHPQRLPHQPTGLRLAVLIDMHKLSIHGSNRLLKTLEEPPEHGCILLTTTKLDDILPTIRSRCVRFHLPSPPLSAEGILHRIQGVDADLLRKLMFEKVSTGAKIELAARLMKEFGWQGLDLIQKAEWILNDHYRRHWREGKISYLESYMRRAQLQKLRSLIARKRITLNAQLGAESLAGPPSLQDFLEAMGP